MDALKEHDLGCANSTVFGDKMILVICFTVIKPVEINLYSYALLEIQCLLFCQSVFLYRVRGFLQAEGEAEAGLQLGRTGDPRQTRTEPQTYFFHMHIDYRLCKQAYRHLSYVSLCTPK